MALFHLIRTADGEEMLVLDPENHGSCAILEADVPAPRVAGCSRVNGRWRIDKEVARASLHEQRMRKSAEISVEVKALDDRLAALEAATSAKAAP